MSIFQKIRSFFAPLKTIDNYVVDQALAELAIDIVAALGSTDNIKFMVTGLTRMQFIVYRPNELKLSLMHELSEDIYINDCEVQLVFDDVSTKKISEYIHMLIL